MWFSKSNKINELRFDENLVFAPFHYLAKVLVVIRKEKNVLNDMTSASTREDGVRRRRGGNAFALSCLTTCCQKTPSAPCLTTPRCQSGSYRGILLLSAIEHALMPYAMPLCRTILPYAIRDDILPANLCYRRSSIASSGCHPRHKVLVHVIKHRTRWYLTTSCRHAHNSRVLGDHRASRHGRDWCLRADGHHAL